MVPYLIQRLRQTLVLLFLLSLFVFVLMELIPGDYLTEMELNPSVSSVQVEQLRREYGLDEPFYKQYFSWITSLLRGNLGYSFVQRRPASTLIAERLLNTLLLSGAAFFIVVALVFPLGTLSALYSGRWPDRLGTWFSLLGLSTPPLVLSIVGIYFAFKTRWFPLGGIGGFAHLVLPALILAIPPTALLARQLRLEMIDALKRPYVVAAAARGLPPTRVALHALRGALNPIISLLGIAWGGLLSGSVVVEQVFDWPGLGLLMVESIRSRDLFVVLNGVLVSSLLIVASNLTADLLLAWNDPRIRYE